MVLVVAAAIYYDTTGLHILWAFCQLVMICETSFIPRPTSLRTRFHFFVIQMSVYIFGLTYIVTQIEATRSMIIALNIGDIRVGEIIRLSCAIISMVSVLSLLHQTDIESSKTSQADINYIIATSVLVAGASQFTHLMLEQEPGLLCLQFLLVVINDVFAYVCGKSFGKRRLIKISPNKTQEGFIGGAICTAAAMPLIEKLINLKFTI